MNNVIIVHTPIVKDLLAKLRNKETSGKDFRNYSETLSGYLVSAALFDQDLEERMIETPLRKTKVFNLKNNFIFVPILRSGMAMLPSALEILPEAHVGVAGLKRDEETAEAYEYYWNVPEIKPSDTILILDPMIATGGTIHAVLGKLVALTTRIRIISIVCASKGISKIHTDFPDVPIITGAVDEKLNDKKYIIPGLGDFGDRYFGTE